VAWWGSDPLRKRAEEYKSVVSTYFFLKKAAFLCHHPKDVQKEKALCTKQVEIIQSHLTMLRADLKALQEKYKSVV